MRCFAHGAIGVTISVVAAFTCTPEEYLSAIRDVAAQSRKPLRQEM